MPCGQREGSEIHAVIFPALRTGKLWRMRSLTRAAALWASTPPSCDQERVSMTVGAGALQ